MSSLKYSREYQAQVRINRRLLGQCILCGLDNSSTYCDKCKVLKSKLWKQRYVQLRKDNKCTKCTKELVGVDHGKVHCTVCQAKSQGYARRKRDKFKTKILNAYGGCKCVCTGCQWHDGQCVVTHISVLTINHINGNGNSHRKSVSKDGLPLAGSRFYRWLEANSFPSGFNVLCSNCNWTHYLNSINII